MTAGTCGGRAAPRARLVAVLALAMGLAAVTHGEPHEPGTAPEVQEFGDWSVACDNRKRCEAISVSKACEARIRAADPGDVAMPILRVLRDPAPDAPPQIRLDRRVWGEASAYRALTLHVQGEDDAGSVGRAYRLRPLSDGLDRLDPRDIDAFLKESLTTTRAATRFAPSGAMHGLISTDGMTAALRYIDEAQGRRDTVTAIYARGSRAMRAPPAPQAATWVRGLPTAPRAVTGEDIRDIGLNICGVMADPQDGDVFALANGQHLWAVDCESESDNPRTLWVIETRPGAFTLAPFPRPEQGRAALPPMLPNSRFDPATGLVTARHDYARGGDCGWQRIWGWTGTAWLLVNGRELHACVGVAPAGWLATWTTGD